MGHAKTVLCELLGQVLVQALLDDPQSSTSSSSYGRDNFGLKDLRARYVYGASTVCWAMGQVLGDTV